MNLTLSPEELRMLTGYQQPVRQLDELRRQGYWRARRSVLGSVILERAHYEAVCRGERQQADQTQTTRPRLKLKVA